LVKTGIGITEELKDMAEIGMKHIYNFENLYRYEDGNLLLGY
jgi:hypothetical protein